MKPYAAELAAYRGAPTPANAAALVAAIDAYAVQFAAEVLWAHPSRTPVSLPGALQIAQAAMEDRQARRGA